MIVLIDKIQLVNVAINILSFDKSNLYCRCEYNDGYYNILKNISNTNIDKIYVYDDIDFYDCRNVIISDIIIEENYLYFILYSSYFILYYSKIKLREIKIKNVFNNK